MNLRDLQYLVATADLLSFSAAAEQCHVSQPTLSGQIKKTEDELGIRIFERSNKKVLLTDEGKDIIVCARRMLKETDNIKQIAENSKDPLSGTFRLGAFPTLAPYVFPKLVPMIKKSMPRLRLVLVEEKTATLIEKLKQGEIDAALLALPVAEADLQSRILFKDRFYLAVQNEHELSSKQKICIGEIDGYNLLLLEEGHCLREQALEVCSRGGAAEEEYRATSLETLRQMVKAGTGITLMPEIAIDKSERGICYIPFKDPTPCRTIALVWRKTLKREAVIKKLLALF